VSNTNVNAPDWDFELEDPFPVKASRVGARAGSKELGASLYELGAGAVSSPFHFHHNNEELLVVLSGSPQLRRPDGRHQLAAGDVVALPTGPDGAHRLENDGPESARVLIVSTRNFPDVADHPDSGKIVFITGAPGSGAEAVAFRYEAEVHPLDGEGDFAAILERDLRAAGR
jgi:uncharacterized cupin superfamily protein